MLPKNLIRASIYDETSGSMKITTHLDHTNHCQSASGKNRSNRWTYRVSMDLLSIYHKYARRLDPPLVALWRGPRSVPNPDLIATSIYDKYSVARSLARISSVPGGVPTGVPRS